VLADGPASGRLNVCSLLKIEGPWNERMKKDPHAYRIRAYRQVQAEGELVSSYVRVSETDLHILAERAVEQEALETVLQCRLLIENYAARHPAFFPSLVPLPPDPLAPPLIRDMLQAGEAAEVGPMAAVAGTIAEHVGRRLLHCGVQEVIVENGGDIFLSRRRDCTVAIFAGRSPLSGKVGLKIDARQMPMAVCTSSGTVGHSLSFGEADSVTVLAASTPLADAVATRLGNEVGRGGGGKGGIRLALEIAQGFAEIVGVVVICGDLMGAVGSVELVQL